MDKAAVLGHPVKKSLSPKLFAAMAKFQKHEVDYRKIDLLSSRLASFVRAKGDYIGFNITIPHKEKIVRLASRLSPEVKAIGAANVLHARGKHLVAYNTDVYGIRQTFREQGLRLSGKQAVVYGAGGAARAVAYALTKEGPARVYVFNRTFSRASRLARHFSTRKTKFIAVRDVSRIEGPISLLVNATPAGQAFEMPAGISAQSLAFDLVYRPKVTPFLKVARKSGLRTVNGLDMLVWQAIATWEIWFGKVGNRSALKEKLCHCVI